jgi:hypothetical protein
LHVGIANKFEYARCAIDKLWKNMRNIYKPLSPTKNIRRHDLRDRETKDIYPKRTPIKMAKMRRQRRGSIGGQKETPLEQQVSNKLHPPFLFV